MLLQLVCIGVAIGAFSLGFKSFTSEGLPLSNQISLQGPLAKLLGVICIAVGLATLAFYAWIWLL